MYILYKENNTSGYYILKTITKPYNIEFQYVQNVLYSWGNNKNVTTYNAHKYAHKIAAESNFF